MNAGYMDMVLRSDRLSPHSTDHEQSKNILLVIVVLNQ